MTHVLNVAFQQGNNTIHITDDEFGFEWGFIPSVSTKETTTDKLNLVAPETLSLSQADIKKRVSDLNRLFAESRKRWGKSRDKPEDASIEPVYMVLENLRSEVFDGKVSWDPITLDNWNRHAGLMPVLVERRAYFEASIDKVLSSAVINDGVSSSKIFGFGGSTIQGDDTSYATVRLYNTTNSSRRTAEIWVGLSSLEGCENFKPYLTGSNPVSFSSAQEVSMVWELDSTSLSVARGTEHLVIARFDELPMAARSVTDDLFASVRVRVTMEKISTIQDSGWRNLKATDYQDIGFANLPPWHIEEGSGRLYLHVDFLTNYGGVSTANIDFLYLLPTDAGSAYCRPQGYSLPYGYELSIDKDLNGRVSSGHAYYHVVGSPFRLTPHRVHRIHVLHGSNLIGVTPASRQTSVTVEHRPRYRAFSDTAYIAPVVNAAGGQGGTPVQSDTRVMFFNHTLPATATNLQITSNGDSESVEYSGEMVKVDWSGLWPYGAVIAELRRNDAESAEYRPAYYSDVVAQRF